MQAHWKPLEGLKPTGFAPHFSRFLSKTIPVEFGDSIAILAQRVDDFLRFALKNSRKKSPSTFRQIVLCSA
jgi:hypothetical protein